MEKNKTQEQTLLELVAILGELSEDAVKRIMKSESYRKRLISTLNSSKHVNTVNKNQLKGYRLTGKSKRKLIEENPERFAHCLTGSVETTKVQYTITRRKRLHIMGDVFTTMNNSCVEVFADRKPAIFSQSEETDETSFAIKNPVFYTSREIKVAKTRWNSIRGSSAVGVLAANNGSWAVCSTVASQERWQTKSETRFRYEMPKSPLAESICRNGDKWIDVRKRL